jgi:hypothetical protein
MPNQIPERRSNVSLRPNEEERVPFSRPANTDQAELLRLVYRQAVRGDLSPPVGHVRRLIV